MSPPTIKRLEQTVVNRIAAGEIIHRPANALKELIENALDARSTQIQILVKDGGLKLLQIQDNGHGIRREDMAIVCERFTTSKLSTFDDLSRIATHGFRGEALASISHVAHVTITTKTAESACAFRACYSDGKLAASRPGQSADPKPCAGNNGTQITAEDLFYNVPTRKKAFKSPADEYNRILDVVSRYAVHNAGISFSCKKQGTTVADIQTVSDATIVDTIRQVYGSSVASELVLVEQHWPELEFSLKAYVSNANYHVKRLTLLLFINHRAVECTAVKRMIESVYAPLLPKGGHPFIYMSLEIKPQNVDVNIHPTKREVHFLKEDMIIDAVGEALRDRLATANQSRTFYTQTRLPGAPSLQEELQDTRTEKPSSKPAVYNYVRTDSRMTTLDAFVALTPRSDPPSRSAESTSTADPVQNGDADTMQLACDENDVQATQQTQGGRKRPRIQVRLTSVLHLRKQVKKSEHAGLTALLSNHAFVGCVDDTLALLQFETKLYLVNYAIISEALFYQVVLNEFNNFGRLRLNTPISIRECILSALEAAEKQGPLPEALQDRGHVAERIVDVLVTRADMLDEYFSITVTLEGELQGLPLLLRGYTPLWEKLPMFLLRMGTEVNWDQEQLCFESLANELAIFYSAEPLTQAMDNQTRERCRWQVQHLVFPSLKTHFVAPRHLNSTQGCITQLASLSDLYKIFERC